MFVEYKSLCQNNKINVGEMHVFKTGLNNPKYIINFPTKKDFKYNSKLSYVRDGLKDLRAQIINNNIFSMVSKFVKLK
jgi:hypothetical protein